jgi:hypothetical protein
VVCHANGNWGGGGAAHLEGSFRKTDAGAEHTDNLGAHRQYYTSSTSDLTSCASVIHMWIEEPLSTIGQ